MLGVGQKRLARHPTTLAAQQRPQIRLTEMVKIVHHFAIHGTFAETHSIFMRIVRGLSHWSRIIKKSFKPRLTSILDDIVKLLDI